MKEKKFRISDYFKGKATVWLLSLSVACLGFFFLSISSSGTKIQNSGTIGKIERRITRRLNILDTYVKGLIDGSMSREYIVDKLPEDMVLYQYEADSLAFWAGLFYVDVDNLASLSFFPVLEHSSSLSGEALRKIGSEYTFISLGGRQYIAFSMMEMGKTIVAALEVSRGALGLSPSRINRNIIRQKSLCFVPIMEDEGFVVNIPSRFDATETIHILKVSTTDALTSTNESPAALSLKCLFIVLLVLFFLVHLEYHPSILSLVLAIVSTLLGAFALMKIGNASTHSLLFSPLLYASGELLPSLGAMI
ncbi:MAG: hypothetical protein HUJ95_06730, partial [Bacteroidales bacterium]|nr:hypothetical protein [Bacteroidales bacterium]